jgi:transposase-like protein
MSDTVGRESYPVDLKFQLVNEYYFRKNETKKVSLNSFAKEKGLAQSTFSQWVNDYEKGKLTKPKTDYEGSLRRQRKGFPEVEEHLVLLTIQRPGEDWTDVKYIQQIAVQVADKLLQDGVLTCRDRAAFNASLYWCRSFLKRNGLSEQKDESWHIYIADENDGLDNDEVAIDTTAMIIESDDLPEQLRAMRYRKLTDEENNDVDGILRGPDNHEVVIDKFNVEMTRNKMLCLKPFTWLNDEVMKCTGI